MRAIYHPVSVLHEPGHFLVRGQPKPVPEKPERAKAIAEYLAERGVPVDTPKDFGPAPRAAVHSRDYLSFLETAYERWAQLPDAQPGGHS